MALRLFVGAGTPLATIGAIVGSTSSFAQDAPQQIESVVITATRSERSLADVPASVTVVERDRILETPGHAIDDVLRTVPSMDLGRVSSYAQHPTSNLVAMRGLLSGITSRMLVMVDGVPINDSFSGFVQWSRVPTDLIDRVEVVRGGGSNLWGTYAMSGVVNIITRQPKEREVSAEAGYGSFNTVSTNVFGATVLSPALTLAANANWFKTDGFNAVPPAERRPLDIPNAFDAGSVNAQGNFIIDPTLFGFLRGHYYKNHQQLGTPLSVNNQDTGDLSGSITKKLGPGALRATAFYHQGHFVTDNVGTPTGFENGFAEFVQNRHTTDVDDYGLSLQWTQAMNKAIPQLSFGVDYRLVDGEDRGDIFDETGPQIRTDVGRGKQRNLGAYALVSVVPRQALEVLASIRWDEWRNFDGFDGSPGGLGSVPDKTATAVSPRLGVRYELTPAFALRAAAYGAFLAPNLDNLYRSFSTPGVIALPNAQLDPERLRGGEVGFDVLAAGLRVQVTAFESVIKDPITTRTISPGDPLLPAGFDIGFQNINAGKLRSRGAEAELTYALGRLWTLDAGYTYVDAVLTDNPVDPSTVGQQIGGVPKNAGNVGLSYRQALGFSGAIRARWTEAYKSLFAGRPLDSATVVDASAAYAFTKQWSAFLQVTNLFDKDYIADDNGFSPRQRGTPFSVFAGVRASL